MDDELESLMTKSHPEAEEGEIERMEAKFHIVDPLRGELEIDRPEGPVRYTLKPLKDLYGQGEPVQSISTMDETHLPLLLTIEQEIVRWYRDNPRLTDAQVLLTLRGLAINPETPCAGDPLGMQLQFGLRLYLSLVDCSRQEVKLALRKIAKSVERHTKATGPRGYVDFIMKYVPA